MGGADQIRAAFIRQAEWCARLEAPLTASLCRILAERLDPGTRIGARVLGWAGDADADALPLRLCGGLHALVRARRAATLAALYPPSPLPAPSSLANALVTTLSECEEALLPWLGRAPQTNEVGRAAPLMAGLLVLADRFRLPLQLYELGASAGLNLQLDRYRHLLGTTHAGDTAAALQLKPDWSGDSPPRAEVRIAGRAAVDLNPVDPISDRERLLAYVWPEQERRRRQLEAALDIAATDPPLVETGDAAEWVETRIADRTEPGVCRVVLHSVAFQYFPPAAQQRVIARLDRVGAGASEAAPLAWLRLEKLGEDEHFSLRLRTWPGEERLLAWSHPHGTWVEWQGPTASAPSRR